MSINSQGAILNQYSPPICVRLPVQGDLLVYDSTLKVWVNRPAKEILKVLDTFLQLLDTPVTFAGAGSSLLAVNSNETGLDYVDIIDAGSYDDPPTIPLPTTSISYENVYCGNIIPLSFLDLKDTPDSYTGHAGELIYVDPTENFIDFVDIVEAGDY